MPEPEVDGCEFKHGKEVGGVLFVARAIRCQRLIWLKNR